MDTRPSPKSEYQKELQDPEQLVLTPRSSSRSILALSLLDRGTTSRTEDSVYSCSELSDKLDNTFESSSDEDEEEGEEEEIEDLINKCSPSTEIKDHTMLSTQGYSSKAHCSPYLRQIALESTPNLSNHSSPFSFSSAIQNRSTSLTDLEAMLDDLNAKLPPSQGPGNSNSVSSIRSDSMFSDAPESQGETSSYYNSSDEELSQRFEESQAIPCYEPTGVRSGLLNKLSGPGTPTTFKSATSSTPTITMVSGKESSINIVGDITENKQLPPLPVPSEGTANESSLVNGSHEDSKNQNKPPPIEITKVKSSAIAVKGHLESGGRHSKNKNDENGKSECMDTDKNSMNIYSDSSSSGSSKDNSRISIPILLSSPLNHISSVEQCQDQNQAPSKGISYDETCEKDAIQETSSLSPLRSPHSIDDQQARIRKKYNLIRELVDTEIRFSTDMGVLLDIYAKKISSERFFGYIGREDLINLFSNVEQIFFLSKRFVDLLYRNLNPRILLSKPDKSSNLSDEFTNISTAMSHYIPIMEPAFQAYCNNNKKQMATFFRIKKLACPIIDKWLTECFEDAKELTSAWTLDALLIKPVQRFLKYPLILQSLIECTDEDHKEYPLLCKVYEDMQQCAARINANTNLDIEVERVTRSPGDMSGSNSVKSPAGEPPLSAKSSWSFKRQSEEISSKRVDIFSGCESGINRLPIDLSADKQLQTQIVQFYSKRSQLKNLVASFRSDLYTIKGHFDSNNRLVQAWLKWNTDGTQSSSEPKPGTSKSRTHNHRSHRKHSHTSSKDSSSPSKERMASGTKMVQRMNAEVLEPLEQVWAMYEKTEALMNARKSYHAAYSKYVLSKMSLNVSNAAASNSAGAVSSLSKDQHVTTVEKQKADLFIKYHNSLRDGLADLFGLTDRVLELSMERFLSVQKRWFKLTMDSMSTAFNINTDQEALDDDGRNNQLPKGLTDNLENYKPTDKAIGDIDRRTRPIPRSRSSPVNNISSSAPIEKSINSLEEMKKSSTLSKSNDLRLRRKGSLLSVANWQMVRPKLSKS